MNTSDDLAMAMKIIAQYERPAKEARNRRRRALVEGDGTEAKRWRAVHKIIVKLRSEQPTDPLSPRDVGF